jgi:hypothetical protein
MAHNRLRQCLSRLLETVAAVDCLRWLRADPRGGNPVEYSLPGYDSPTHDAREAVAEPAKITAPVAESMVPDDADGGRPVEEIATAPEIPQHADEPVVPAGADSEQVLRYTDWTTDKELPYSESGSRRSSLTSSHNEFSAISSTVSNMYSHSWSRSPTRRRASSPAVLRTHSPGAVYPHRIVGHIRAEADARMR